MRWVLFLCSLSVLGQNIQIFPSVVKQGDAIRISTPLATATTARMGERTIRLFPEDGGARFGLMPVAADQAPGKYKLEILDKAGTVLDRAELTIYSAHFLKQNVKLQPEVQNLKPAPGEMETVRAFRNNVSDTRYWGEPFARPIAGCMSSPFGVQRLYNGKPSGNYHSGIDQRSPAGQSVHALAAGVVRLVRPYNIHGNVVGVDHGQGLESIYLHLSKFATSEGATVKKGDVLGYVGSTGRSTGPHLHWSVYANGVAVNPAQWITVKPCGPATPAKSRAPRRSK